jgi:hypothetical protein
MSERLSNNGESIKDQDWIPIDPEYLAVANDFIQEMIVRAENLSEGEELFHEVTRKDASPTSRMLYKLGLFKGWGSFEYADFKDVIADMDYQIFDDVVDRDLFHDEYKTNLSSDLGNKDGFNGITVRALQTDTGLRINVHYQFIEENDLCKGRSCAGEDRSGLLVDEADQSILIASNGEVYVKEVDGAELREIEQLRMLLINEPNLVSHLSENQTLAQLLYPLEDSDLDLYETMGDFYPDLLTEHSPIANRYPQKSVEEIHSEFRKKELARLKIALEART